MFILLLKWVGLIEIPQIILEVESEFTHEVDPL